MSRLLSSYAVGQAPALDRTGGLRLGRPAYRVQISDLQPAAATCSYCGGPNVVLLTQIPEGEGGGHDQGPPRHDLIGGYTRFFDRTAPCERCQLLSAVARLFPSRSPTSAGIESETEATARMVRGMLAPVPEPAPGWAPPADARFDPGTVFITESAGLALDRTLGRNLRAQGVDAAGAAGVGREFAGPILERHVRGDHGQIGQLADGDAQAGERWPLCAPLDRNAASVRDGRGSVRSAYQLERFERRRGEWGGLETPQLAERVPLRVWSEIGPNAVTLVYSDVDGVDV